jgi:hypothetical protein
MGWKGGKEMNVIGHDDIATNGDIMLSGDSRKNAKSVVNFITCQEPLAFVRVERDEVERANIVKQTSEPGRTPRPSFHRRAWHSSFLSIVVSEVNCCSHGAVPPCCWGARGGSASTQRGGYNVLSSESQSTARHSGQRESKGTARLATSGPRTRGWAFPGYRIWPGRGSRPYCRSWRSCRCWRGGRWN